MPEELDAVVVGAGPNGLAAAIELARGGYSVRVLEARPEAAGGMHSGELTLPGFIHDHCSAIHPTGLLSPFFRSLPLADHGLEWRSFDASVAHPLDDGPAALLYRSFEQTGERLGADRAAWQALLEPLVDRSDDLLEGVLAPLGPKFRHPLLMGRFAASGLRGAAPLARARFKGDAARALFGGCAAHSVLPLEAAGSAAVGLLFAAMGHVADWPCVRGGTAELAGALGRCLEAYGGSIETGRPVRSLADLPAARVVLFDLAPKPLLAIAGERFPAGFRRRLEGFRYGPGTFKVDWALDGPVPWRDPEVGRASTVHVGGPLEALALSEREVWAGRACDAPYLIVCQQSVADSGRAPEGRHTGYAYCHVPHGFDGDWTDRVEAQVERFAPGFRDRILARHATSPAALEAGNPNYVGGAITGGAADLRQLFFRPSLRLDPYSTPDPRLFICSASTPPGGGVHGMCGYWAARSAIRRLARGR